MKRKWKAPPGRGRPMLGRRLRITIGAAALALGGGGALATGISAPATAQSSGATAVTKADSHCVQPDRSLFNYSRDHLTFTVSLKDDSTVTCTDFVLNVGSYTIPPTWNRQGWNETILPQDEFFYTQLVFPAGSSQPVSATAAAADCGPFQSDLYLGPRLTHLEWPAPMKDVRISGVIVDQPNCTTQSPSPTPTPSGPTSQPTSPPTTAPPSSPPTTSPTGPTSGPTLPPPTSASTTQPTHPASVPPSGPPAPPSVPPSVAAGAAGFVTPAVASQPDESSSSLWLELSITFAFVGFLLLVGVPLVKSGRKFIRAQKARQH